MKDAILIELASRWEKQAKNNESLAYEDSPDGLKQMSKDEGERETLRMCADTLRTLVSIIGEKTS